MPPTNNLARTSNAPLPESRTIGIAPSPIGVEIAAMVSEEDTEGRIRTEVHSTASRNGSLGLRFASPRALNRMKCSLGLHLAPRTPENLFAICLPHRIVIWI